MKKEIVMVNVNGSDDEQQDFIDTFIDALAKNQVIIKYGKIQVETDKKYYVVSPNDFGNAWSLTFKVAFEKLIEKYLNFEKMNLQSIAEVYIWSNPVFSQIPNVCESSKFFLNELESKLQNVEYRNKMRKMAFELMPRLDPQIKKSYCERFISLGVLQEKDKIELQYYEDYSAQDLIKLFSPKKNSPDESRFTEDEMGEIFAQCFVYIKDTQRNAKQKGMRFDDTKVINLLNLAAESEIVGMFAEGYITTEEFCRTRVVKKHTNRDTKEIMLEKMLQGKYIPRIIQVDEVGKIISIKESNEVLEPVDRLRIFLETLNSSLPEEIQLTSPDFVNSYGKRLNGSSLNKLLMDGYIYPEDLIEVFEINKALSAVHDEENMFSNEELKAYYTPTVLVKMQKDRKFSPRFMQLYLELQDFKNNPEVFRKKSQALVQELNATDAKLQEDVLELYDIGLCDLETAKDNISQSFFEDKFSEDSLTTEQIIGYYNKGIISEKTISNFFNNNELFALYQTGKANGKILMAVNDVNLLQQKFLDGEIADYDFLELYFNGNISINDLSDGLEMAEKTIDISSFITEETPYAKIKELFSSFVIDYAALLSLQSQGILSSEQLEELKTLLNTKEFFEELRKGSIYSVSTNREKESAGGRTPSVLKLPKEEKDFSKEIALISEILEKDVEKEPDSFIESKNAAGKPTTLNNYRIFGNEELDGIIILQKSKRGNAVYVMNVHQLMYFLHGEENNEGKIEVRDRGLQDKAYLRTLQGVRIVNHGENFGRNLVEATAQISPKIKERVKKADAQYVDKTKRLIEKLKEQYMEDKVLGLN